MFLDIYNKYFLINLKDYSNIGIDLEISKLLLFVFAGLIVACIIVNYRENNIALLLKNLIRTESVGADNAKTLKDLGLYDNRIVKLTVSRDSGMLTKMVSFIGKHKLSYEEYLAKEKAKKDKKRKKESNKEQNQTVENAVHDAASTTTTSQSIDSKDVQEQFTATDSTAAEVTLEQPDSPYLSNGKLNFDTARFYIIPGMEKYADKYFERKSSSVLKTTLSCSLIFGFYLVILFSMPTILAGLNAILAK